jgi:hypothetical protein
LNVLKKDNIYYVNSAISVKEIASVSLVWQVIGAVSVTSNIGMPVLHQKLHNIYENITSLIYSNAEKM